MRIEMVIFNDEGTSIDKTVLDDIDLFRIVKELKTGNQVLLRETQKP